MRKTVASQWEPAEAPNSRHKPAVRKVKAESANMLKGSEELHYVPFEYHDLGEAVSKKESDVLPPHNPTDCATEIFPGAKLPKLKMYSMMLREMEELQRFIDKNLGRGFIQPAKSRMAAPVLFKEKTDYA